MLSLSYSISREFATKNYNSAHKFYRQCMPTTTNTILSFTCVCQHKPLQLNFPTITLSAQRNSALL